MITQYMGKRVFSAVLDEPLMANVKVLHTQVDPDSHQEWQQVSVTAWTTDQDYINTLAPIWNTQIKCCNPPVAPVIALLLQPDIPLTAGSPD